MPGPSKPVTACLGLGGNLGDPQAAMARLLQALDAHEACVVTAVSGLFRTPPWGVTDQPDFLNCGAAVSTTLSPSALLSFCLSLERDLKRVRDRRWGPRTIDADILLYGDQTVEEEGLTIPHPRMAERAFVLVPLAEIAPDAMLDGQAIAKRAEAIGKDGMTRLDVPEDWWKG